MTPDQINAQHRALVYACRACGATSGLHWWGGTSCPCCARPGCSEILASEVAAAEADEDWQRQEWGACYGRSA